jgi:ferric-dicitrate binding protein FerR (iron transport regulator)
MTSFTSQKQILGCALFAWLAMWLLPTSLRAQSNQAWVNSVQLDAKLTRAGGGTFSLRRNDPIEANDVIVTGAGARVVIAFTDGSQVTIFPNSRVTFKDFRTPHLARELLEIAIGRVRVKIRRLGKQHNPYRVNSPAASIAVRGTAFWVEVQASGDTRVAVTEGLVEVVSRADANEKWRLAAGQQVIVGMRGRIGLAQPGPGGELDGRIAAIGATPVQNLAATYQRSVEAVAQNSIETQPVLFAAFADAHLDSLDNPAYAAEFRQGQGRLLLLPAIRRTDRLVVRNGGVGVPVLGFPETGRPQRFNYTLTPQFSLFAPVPNSRWTLGGSITGIRTSLHALTLYESSETKLAQLAGAINTDGAAAELTAVQASFIAARRFGRDGRSSLGIQLEQLAGDGSFLNVQQALVVGVTTGAGIESQTRLSRTRATLGFAHQFTGGGRFGVFYRHGVTSVDQQNRLRVPGRNDLLPYDDTSVSTAGSEIGLRWRASLARRVFYGLEASGLWERIESQRALANQLLADEQDRARRLRLGAGLGVALRRHSFFSLDLSGGGYRTTKPVATGIIAPRFRSERGHFFSAHAALQSDLGRRAFASASFLLTMRRGDFEIENFSAASPVLKSVVQPPFRQNLRGTFSNVGLGWKFKPNLIAEYILSMDHQRRAPSHSLLLRYTFDVKLFGEN